MAKDLRSENDNLKEWRDKKKSLTEQLIIRAIEELQSLNAKINQKNVCEMMQKLVTAEDKKYNAVITTSAISKNEIYKNMILEANEKSKSNNTTNQKYKMDGDKQFEIFKLKTMIAKKEAKIKELESIIDRANIQSDRTYKINNSTEEVGLNLKEILCDLIEFTRNEGITFIDDKDNLVEEDNHNILIASNIIKKLEIK